jgi:hypothetical protein
LFIFTLLFLANTFASNYIKTNGVVDCLEIKKDDYEDWIGKVNNSDYTEEELFIYCSEIDKMRAEMFEHLKGSYFLFLI